VHAIEPTSLLDYVTKFLSENDYPYVQTNELFKTHEDHAYTNTNAANAFTRTFDNDRAKLPEQKVFNFILGNENGTQFDNGVIGTIRDTAHANIFYTKKDVYRIGAIDDGEKIRPKLEDVLNNSSRMNDFYELIKKTTFYTEGTYGYKVKVDNNIGNELDIDKLLTGVDNKVISKIKPYYDMVKDKFMKRLLIEVYMFCLLNVKGTKDNTAKDSTSGDVNTFKVMSVCKDDVNDFAKYSIDALTSPIPWGLLKDVTWNELKKIRNKDSTYKKTSTTLIMSYLKEYSYMNGSDISANNGNNPLVTYRYDNSTINIDKMEALLAFTGFTRFNTNVVRNLFFISNVLRIIRLQINREFTQNRNILKSSHFAIAPSVTEYGMMDPNEAFKSRYRGARMFNDSIENYGDNGVQFEDEVE
jgi:hypothetical protein